jgi:hypothetical protein
MFCARFMPTLAFATTAWLLVALAGGCATTPTAPQPQQATPATLPTSAPTSAPVPVHPSFALLARHALEAGAPAPIEANDLVGRVGEERTLAVVAGRAAGERRTQRVIALEDGTVVIEESTRAGVERSVLRLRDDGGYALRSVDTPGENSRSAFSQELEFAPPLLVGGGASESASPMRVTLLSSGKMRAAGSATRSQRVVGRADIDVCGERLVATIVETVFVADLDNATARRESELFVVPGRGVVAERWREKVTVLGIFPKTTEETVVVIPTKGTP